jgi:hypothetical protein
VLVVRCPLARCSFVRFRLVVATIAGFVGAGFRSSLAGGGAVMAAGSALGRLARLVTTAGPVRGAACCFRGGRL